MPKLTEDELKKFDTITDAYNKLVECQTMLKQVSVQVEQDFRTQQDDINKIYYFPNPINIDYELKHNIDKVKSDIIEFILRYMDIKFSNLVIDEQDVRKFIELGEANQKLQFDLDQPEYNQVRPVMRAQFTTRAVIQYIEVKYADEETITLQQIKEFASHALPWLGDYRIEKASKPEHIPVNKTWIELNGGAYYQGYKTDPTAAIIKLIHIKLNHVLPSQAEHHSIDYGGTYRDDKIKTLRRYKNGKLKIQFYNEDDMETMRRTLVEANSD